MKSYLSLLLCLIPFCLSAQILTQSNLPIVMIQTGNNEIPDEPKINATMSIINNGPGMINRVNDVPNEYVGRIGIETRGNSTQAFNKKTYSLELRSSTNQDSSVNLFGMGKEEDWILHAMVIDKTQLRIPMSFYFSRKMGHYAAKWRYVELIIDGDYRGLYIFTERLKRDDDRVDIEKMTRNDVAGDAVTGGYILRIDWLEEDGFESQFKAQGPQNMFYQWYYPKADDIQPQQELYISNYVTDFEKAVFSPSYVNPKGKHYSEYIETNSFIDFLLVNEISKNADGYKLSSYLHKDRDSKGGKLTAGPIWDFDQTYGMSLVCSCHDPTGWTYLQNQDGCEDLDSMPLWWQALVSDTAFSQRLQARWRELRQGVFHRDSIFQWIDEHRQLIQPAIDRNYQRWPDVIGESIWIEPEPIPQSYSAEISYMKDWIGQRLIWMDSNMSSIALDLEPITKELAIFPNPVKDHLTIKGHQGDIMQIIGINGQRMYTAVIMEEEFNVELTGFAPGMYILAIESEKANYFPMKFMVIP